MKNLKLRALPLALALSLAPTVASAQETIEFPQASPSAFLRETIGLTTVEIEYARPGVKDRKIFGGLVPYGELWRTGANAATKLTFSTDVTFGGKKIAAGSYALFTIPGEKEWTVILNKAVGEWGSYNYNEANDVARIQVSPVTLAQPVETMHIGLHHVRDDSATLAITWEKTRVPVAIQTNLVEMLVPKIEEVMAAEGGEKPYFQAAMFYYHHDLDLTKAIEWMDAALEQRPDAVWILYRKGLILEKAGDKQAALATAQKALQQAKGMQGELGAEYTRLSETLIARVK